MKQSASAFLTSIEGLQPLERAAAIAHRIYSLTSHRVGWPQRVPEDWNDLDTDAQHYNMASIQTWMQEDDLLDRFIHAVLDYRFHITSDDPKR